MQHRYASLDDRFPADLNLRLGHRKENFKKQ